MNPHSLWMIAASALFACMGVCVKLGASLFSSAELVFYRGFDRARLPVGYSCCCAACRWPRRTGAPISGAA
jgi:hypothetical protein